MEQKNKFGTVFAIFIMVIIGVALLRVIGDYSYSAVNTQTNRNETVNIFGCRNASNYYQFVNTSFVVMDLTDVKVSSINEVRWSNGTILTLNTDYLVTGYSTVNPENITIALQNTSKNVLTGNSSNFTVVDYTYYPSTYVDNATGRSLISNLLVLFFVIAIVGGVIGYFWKDQLFEMLGR